MKTRMLASNGLVTNNQQINNQAITPLKTSIKPLSLSVFLMTTGLTLGHNIAVADIVADSSAPTQQQPSVVNSANGTPQVNIQAPNRNGLSRNTYQQFDVDSRGVILNNSRNSVQTQLGGFIVGNQNLIGGEARVILNEVNSSDPSQLKGFIEIAGQRADVIVANPAGITCDGCGFINSAGSTLTTGTPIINGGALTGFNVDQGTVTIEGAGLNGLDADYTSIIARATEVTANVHANEIRVVAGANEVSANGLNATAKASTTDAPTVAIDVSELGGMYAGKIHLIATAQGVGVNNAGIIAADAGNLTLNADGTLSNTGVLAAANDLIITNAPEVNNSGNLRADNNLQINADSVTNSANISAQNNIQIDTLGAINQTETGVIAAGADRDLTLATAGSVSIHAGANLDNAGQITASQQAEVTAEVQLTNEGSIDALTTVVAADTVVNEPTGQVFGDDIIINANELNNVGDGNAAPVIAARNTLNIATNTLTNSEEALIFSAGDLRIGGALDAGLQAVGFADTVQNNSATIEASGDLNLSALNVFNTNEHLNVTQVNLSSQNFTQFKLEAGLRVTGRDFITRYTQGQINFVRCRNRQCINVLASGDQSDSYTRFNFTRTISEDLLIDSLPGQILAGGDLTLSFDEANNEQSRIIAGGNLDLQGASFNNINQTGRRIIDDRGTATLIRSVGFWGIGRNIQSVTNYNPAKVEETIELVAAETQGNTQTNTNNSQSIPDVVTLDSANITLPTSSLFQVAPASDSQFLIETDPRFTDRRTFLSSDLFLNQVQADPNVTQKRLGDGFFEQRLVQEQITQLTGQRFLSGYNSNENQYRSLLQAGVDYAQSFSLSPGIALSAAEMRNLTQDIVWLVEQQITLDDGTTQAVLVPQLYLANADGRQQQSVATVSAGGNTNIDLSDNLNSDGLIQAGEGLNVQAQNISTQGGSLRGNTVALTSHEDTTLNGTQVVAQDQLSINAGRDVTIAAVVGETSNSQNQRNYTSQSKRKFISQRAGLSTTADGAQIQVNAGRDINLQAAQITSQGSAELQAGNDVNLSTVKTQQSDKVTWGRNYSVSESYEQAIGSSIEVQGDIRVNAGNDINLQAAQITSQGSAEIQAGNDLNLLTAKNKQANKAVWRYRRNNGHVLENNEQEIGSSIQTQGDLSLTAQQSLQARGASINSNDGDVAIEASDIAFSAAEDKQSYEYKNVIKKKGLFSSKTITIFDQVDSTRARGTEVSGQNVQLLSSGNLQLSGAQLVADNDLSLNSDKNLTVNGALNQSSETRFRETKKSGLFGGGGFGISIGSLKQSTDSTTKQGYITTSTLGSLNGDVSINAGEDVKLTSTDLLAQQGNISVTGNNVTLDSTNETLEREDIVKFKQSGLSLSLSGGVIDSINTVKNSVERISSTDNSKLQALHAWRAGKAVQGLEGGLNSLQNIGNDFENPLTPNTSKDASSAPQTSGINLSLSLGSSKSEQTTTVNNKEALGSSLIANGDINITARGDSDAPESGNILSRGSLIDADNVTLTAANDIQLTSAENIRKENSQSKSSSSGIGVSLGSGGLQVFAEASRSRGEVNKSSDKYLETQINAANTATLNSGDDTRLEGAQVNAERIVANVGGDLDIISQQDEEHYRNRQETVGGRIGVGIGPQSPVSLSLNYSELKADSEYVAVQEQSGLFAGQGGFDVNVSQNTDLQGGAIVSEADPENNRLSTETLSFNNLENNAKYNVESKSISFSTSTVEGAQSGFGGGFSNDEGEASNTTFAAISEGNIEVRANPDQSLDDLKRSREQAHQVLARIFSEDKITEAQEQVELTQIFAEEAYLVVGDAYKEIANLEAVLETDLPKEQERAELEARLNTLKAIWPEDKAIAHALVGGLTSVLGGSNFAQGALAAGLNESLSSELEKALGNSKTLNNLAKTVIGGLTGGTQGALISANADKYNRQLHPDELKLIAENAETFAREQGIEDVAEARRILIQVALYNNDSLWQQVDAFGETHQQYGETASHFLQTVAQQAGDRLLFTATDDEFENHAINSQYLTQYDYLYDDAFEPLTGISGRSLNVSSAGLALWNTLHKGQINSLNADEQKSVLADLKSFISEVEGKAAVAEANVTNTSLSAEQRQAALREYAQLSSLYTRLDTSLLQLVVTANGIDGSKEARLAYVEALSLLSATGVNLSRSGLPARSSGGKVTKNNGSGAEGNVNGNAQASAGNDRVGESPEGSVNPQAANNGTLGLPAPTHTVPDGYTVKTNANGTATVTGPRGGEYQSTGFYDGNGNQIYQSNSGGYVTLNGGRVDVAAPRTGSSVPIHHVCTNKNCVGTANGGPWTPRYQAFFDGADLNINKATENLVSVPGHRGPHPAAYHQYVYDQLDSATDGLRANTPEFRRAVTNTLNQIKQEAVTPGSQVNNWLTGQ